MKILRIVKSRFVNLRWLYRAKILLLLLFVFFVITTTTFSTSTLKYFYPAESMCINNDNFLNEFKIFHQGLSVHQIQSGETLYRLSKECFVDLEELIAVNEIKNPRLVKAGQKILIPAVIREAPYIQKIQVNSSEVVHSLIKKFQLEAWQFKRLNPALNIAAIHSPTIIYLPRYAVAANHSKNVFNLIVPVRGFISSRYGFRWGRMHYGMDLAAPMGTPVKASASGKVIAAGWNGGYGLCVRLNHRNMKTLYGHLSRILVKKGSLVQQGQVIGLVGATGKAFGSHLHFEIERDGRKINPGNYILRK